MIKREWHAWSVQAFLSKTEPKYGKLLHHLHLCFPFEFNAGLLTGPMRGGWDRGTLKSTLIQYKKVYCGSVLSEGPRNKLTC